GGEPRVAVTRVPVTDRADSGGVRRALGDVIRCGLQVDPAGDSARRSHGPPKVADLPHDDLEQPGLVAVWSRDGVPMHRIAKPDHRVPGGSYVVDEPGQAI